MPSLGWPLKLQKIGFTSLFPKSPYSSWTRWLAAITINCRIDDWPRLARTASRHHSSTLSVPQFQGGKLLTSFVQSQSGCTTSPWILMRTGVLGLKQLLLGVHAVVPLPSKSTQPTCEHWLSSSRGWNASLWKSNPLQPKSHRFCHPLLISLHNPSRYGPKTFPVQIMVINMGTWIEVYLVTSGSYGRFICTGTLGNTYQSRGTVDLKDWMPLVIANATGVQYWDVDITNTIVIYCVLVYTILCNIVFVLPSLYTQPQWSLLTGYSLDLQTEFSQVMSHLYRHWSKDRR